MTPGQQQDLEALSGRPMTADEIALAESRNDDATLAVSLSSTLAPIVVSVSSSVFLAWTVSCSVRGTIQDASQNAQHPLRDSALAIIDLIRSQIDLDLSMSAIGQGNQAILQAWVDADVITSEHVEVLISAASKPAAPISMQVVSDILNGE